ncbi:MAG: hypothetical protein ACR5K4_04000 [Sodalis sp. (in: enterobacteria)]
MMTALVIVVSQANECDFLALSSFPTAKANLYFFFDGRLKLLLNVLPLQWG